MQTPKGEKKYCFAKQWSPDLEDDGFVAVSAFFLKNYHRLHPYDLTYGEAMFTIHLMQHKWNEDAPFPAYKTIAERMSVSVKSARRWAVSLEQKGYLVREIRRAQTNRFHLDKLVEALVALKKAQPRTSKKE